jgi:hypothetical protein
MGQRVFRPALADHVRGACVQARHGRAERAQRVFNAVTVRMAPRAGVARGADARQSEVGRNGGAMRSAAATAPALRMINRRCRSWT